MSIDIKKALKKAIKALKKAGIKSAELDAEILLCFVLNKSKSWLYTYTPRRYMLKKTEITKYFNLINCRTNHEPIAYLTGHKEFYGSNFIVNKNILIPRPETELIVDIIINKIKNKKLTCLPARQEIKNIVDVGTGSGCIIIALAKTMKLRRDESRLYFHATDISKKALTVARANAKKHRVKINFFQGNLLSPIKNKKNDIIIANLPYLNDKKTNLLKLSEAKSLKFEPHIALYGGKDGLDWYKKLFIQINKLKHQPKLILCEFDPRQSTKIKKLAKKYFFQAKINIKKDLANLDRILLIENL